METEKVNGSERELPPTEMGADRLAVAAIIMDAAAKLNAAVHWRLFRTSGWGAIIVLSEGEVTAYPVSPKLGVRVDTHNNSQTSYYTNPAALARYVRGSIAREKAADKRDAEKREEQRHRDKAGGLCRRDASNELRRVFGDAIVDACMTVDDHWPDGSTTPVARVNVYVGRRIEGVKLSVGEAVRFATVMMAAGYDLIKLADEMNQ